MDCLEMSFGAIDLQKADSAFLAFSLQNLGKVGMKPESTSST